MKCDQLQKDVQHWLSPPDPSTNQDFVSKARHKGTAAWFFESSALTEWKARGSLLWIHGKPGAGKSTLFYPRLFKMSRDRLSVRAGSDPFWFPVRPPTQLIIWTHRSPALPHHLHQLSRLTDCHPHLALVDLI